MNWGAGKGRRALRLAHCVFLFVAVFAWPHSLAATAAAGCTGTAELRIKIKSTVLSVPRRYSPNIFAVDSDSVGHAKDICQGPDAPPIPATKVAINPGTDQRIELKPDSMTMPIWHVQIEIDLRPSPFDAPERRYTSVVERIESHGSRLAALPRKHGFIAFDGPSRKQPAYIALPDTVGSLDLVPFVIECASRDTLSSDGWINYGRSCNTTYYRVTGELVVRYSFYDGRHPIETWRELDAEVRGFVRGLIAAQENRATFAFMSLRSERSSPALGRALDGQSPDAWIVAVGPPTWADHNFGWGTH